MQRIHSDAYRGGETLEPASVGQRDVAHRDAHRLGDAGRAVDVAVVQQHDELLTTQPHHGVGTTNRHPQASRDSLQQQVAHGVAGAVVHRLEVVEVDQQERQRLAVTRGAGEIALAGVAQPSAVVEAR